MIFFPQSLYSAIQTKASKYKRSKIRWRWYGLDEVAPNTLFRPHVHPGGEEIFVLEGVFHDEDGSYPSGTWIRSPRFSKHAPFTKSEGAVIYVKTGHLDYEV